MSNKLMTSKLSHNVVDGGNFWIYTQSEGVALSSVILWYFLNSAGLHQVTYLAEL